MEKLPKQNYEEINISEKIGEYKDFINSLREKYADKLDNKYSVFLGSIPGRPEERTFTFIINSKEVIDPSLGIDGSSPEYIDEARLEEIRFFLDRNFISKHDSLDASLLVTGEQFKLREWLDRFDQSLDRLSTLENN